MTPNWPAYFDSLRHDSPLFRKQSALYVESLRAVVELHRDQRVLDFGCGFGLVAAQLAPLVAEIWMWDPSPNMHSVAARTTAGLPNVRFCDLEASGVMQQEPAMQPRELDLILVNSVAQYMAFDDLTRWLARWRDMLAPAGKLVLSDLIPPHHSGLADIADLLRFGARNRHGVRTIRKALGGLVQYWWTTRARPLTHVGREDLARRAAEVGLTTTVLPRNLTHFTERWTAVLNRQVLEE